MKVNNLKFSSVAEIETFYQKDELFLKTIHSFLTDDRFNHVKSVAKLSFDVALKFNLNSMDAFISGLLHDLTKDLSKDLQLYFSKENKYYIENLPSFSLHAFSSAVLAKKLFDINDDVFETITFHCTGKENMSILEKLIYTADKCEPTRKFKTNDILNLLYTDIDKAFISELKSQQEYLKSINVDNLTNKYTIDMYNFYKGEF